MPIVKLSAVLLLAAVASGGSTYYVDCASGDDSAGGSSRTSAWRTVQAISAHEFRAGDTILLKRGTHCTGLLWPKGSGTADAPIVLDAYGEGALPQVRADPGAEAAFRLFNQEYWTVQHLEFIGGQPHGVYISGTQGVLHRIHLRALIVHSVTGEPTSKEGGLVVIAPGSAEQRFDDVLVDGVTAYGTSQWAGILVGSVAHGFLPVESRSTGVMIRNSIVHDVAGDGIVLFQVNRGAIESSVAWYTGMQRTETIGTPNAIWTWMCRECAVRRCEAFLTDSPGVDGGAFDIDYGDDGNVVEDSYGHDTQGYCVAIFGAGAVTTGSVVRRNVCAGNGRSPRLAALQGAVFLSTWNSGQLQGVEFSENRISWNPPIAAAAIVNTAEFKGSGTFANNTIESSVTQAVRSNASLRFEHNSVRKPLAPPADPTQHAQMPRLRLPGANTRPGAWRLYGFVPASGDDAAILASACRQFHAAGLDTILIAPANLGWDWNLGEIPVVFDDGSARGALHITVVPAAMLVNPAGQIVWRHDGPTAPGELGLALRTHLGNPDYARLISEP